MASWLLSNKNKISHTPPYLQPPNSEICVDKSGYSEVIGSLDGRLGGRSLRPDCQLDIPPSSSPKEHNPRNTEHAAPPSVARKPCE